MKFSKNGYYHVLNKKAYVCSQETFWASSTDMGLPEELFHCYPELMIEGSLEVKLPTICRDGKAEGGRVRTEKSRSEKRREEKEWEARRRGCEKR